MHKFCFSEKHESPLTLLFLGAHSDDIEIGCGGTILRWLGEFSFKEIWWVVFSAAGQRAEEARQSAALFTNGVEKTNIVTQSFRDGFFPYTGTEIKDYLEELKLIVSPDVIFTHYRHDLHQDHRLISDLTWNTFRDHTILEYEIVKYDGDIGSPNFFVHLTDEICRNKLKNIERCFKTQGNRQWFADDTFLSMLRLRGIESNAPGKYAEAFYCRKIVV
jgi:LmbE family N-acetylglucosaminyl deacetylase